MIIFGPVSGGHFNPAITLGILLKEIQKEGDTVANIIYHVFIIISQVIGAILGVFIVYLSYTEEILASDTS